MVWSYARKKRPSPLNLAKSQECGSTSLLLKLIPGTCFHIAPAWALNNVVSHGEKSPMCTYSMHVFVINTKNVYASLTCAVCMYHHVSWCQNNDQKLRKCSYVGADIYWEDNGLSLTVKQRTAECFQILYSRPLRVIGWFKLLQDASSRMPPPA